MNVAKNWALAIMSIALTFAHFSSRANCCWKSEWLSLLKKTFTNAGHIDAKLIDFSEICQRKTQRNRLFFTDCFLAKFPPEISCEIGRFFKEFARENPSKFDFFPLKSREIGRFSCKFWLFSRENPAKSADCSANFDFFPVKISRFFREFAPENPAKFCFFSREISEALFIK